MEETKKTNLEKLILNKLPKILILKLGVEKGSITLINLYILS